MDADGRAVLGGEIPVRRYLSWLLLGLLLAALIGVAYIAVNPPITTDPYTEFYILGPEGNASDYPANLSVGEVGRVIVGISNHEHETVTYRLVVAWNVTVVHEIRIRVPDAKTEERRLAVRAPDNPGTYRLRFLLYRGQAIGDPYRSLRLMVTVRE